MKFPVNNLIKVGFRNVYYIKSTVFYGKVILKLFERQLTDRHRKRVYNVTKTAMYSFTLPSIT